MPEFNDLDSLLEFAQKEIKDSMETDVSQDMVEVVQEHVDTDVYEAYTPKDYIRTGMLKNNVRADMIDDNTLQITDPYIDEGRNVTEIVETGQGYDWGYNLDERIGERPFLDNAAYDISEHDLDKESLTKSLKRKGFDVK